MGNYADNFFGRFHGVDDRSSSRWCESRSRPPLGRKMVRLEGPIDGRKEPCRLRCQVPVCCFTSADWYRARGSCDRGFFDGFTLFSVWLVEGNSDDGLLVFIIDGVQDLMLGGLRRRSGSVEVGRSVMIWWKLFKDDGSSDGFVFGRYDLEMEMKVLSFITGLGCSIRIEVSQRFLETWEEGNLADVWLVVKWAWLWWRYRKKRTYCSVWVCRWLRRRIVWISVETLGDLLEGFIDELEGVGSLLFRFPGMSGRQNAYGRMELDWEEGWGVIVLGRKMLKDIFVAGFGNRGKGSLVNGMNFVLNSDGGWKIDGIVGWSEAVFLDSGEGEVWSWWANHEGWVEAKVHLRRSTTESNGRGKGTEDLLGYVNCRCMTRRRKGGLAGGPRLTCGVQGVLSSAYLWSDGCDFRIRSVMKRCVLKGVKRGVLGGEYKGVKRCVLWNNLGALKRCVLGDWSNGRYRSVKRCVLRDDYKGVKRCVFGGHNSSMKRYDWKERWKKVLQDSSVDGYGVLEIRRWTYAGGVEFDGVQKLDLRVGWTVNGDSVTGVWLRWGTEGRCSKWSHSLVLLGAWRCVWWWPWRCFRRSTTESKGGSKVTGGSESGELRLTRSFLTSGLKRNVLFIRSGVVKRSVLWGGLEEKERCVLRTRWVGVKRCVLEKYPKKIKRGVLRPKSGAVGGGSKGLKRNVWTTRFICVPRCLKPDSFRVKRSVLKIDFGKVKRCVLKREFRWSLVEVLSVLREVLADKIERWFVKFIGVLLTACSLEMGDFVWEEGWKKELQNFIGIDGDSLKLRRWVHGVVSEFGSLLVGREVCMVSVEGGLCYNLSFVGGQECADLEIRGEDDFKDRLWWCFWWWLWAENQSDFVPGRILSDNILIAHELLHYLKGFKNGPNKGAAVKLDMEKAYDRVEWHFINDVMEKMGFAASWIDLIMNCVTSVSFCIKVNGHVSDFFRPSRGLRKGDPLSPYLFLFCTQGLSALLLKEQSLGNIKGVRASQNGPRITHLLYADDCLLFLKNSADQARRLKDILSCYEGSSGQKVNVEKSYIYFSNGMTDESKREISSVLNMREELEVGNYLGLPLIVGKSKLQALGFLTEKVDKRVNGWTKNLLSFGGREVLLKAVAQALPAYAMSCFMLPECILEPITITMRRYWWSGRANARGWAHVAWNKVYRPKLLGGIGLRDLHLFNLAMLAKQIWRLLTCKNSLCFKVISAKYFLGGNILEARRGDKPSFIWSGLYKMKEEFSQGFWWRPGMHSEIKMFKDCWGGDKQIIFSTVHGDNSPNPVRCKEFIRRLAGLGHHPSGVYNVKSRYRWIVNNRGMEGDHSSIWKTIVSMATLPKIKVFAGRLCFEALFLGRKLAAAGIDPGICKMCQGLVETGLHAFRECPSIKEAFDLSNLSICLPAGEFTDCKTWLESVQLNMNQKQFTFFMTLLWNLWNRRNKWIHEGQLIPQRIVVDYAQLLSVDLLNSQETSRASNSNASQERWARPLQDRIKINVDGAFNPTSRKAAVGVIARNSHGMMVDGCAFQLEGSHTAESAEACAFKEGITLAIANGWNHVDFEGDAVNIVCKLDRRELDRSFASAHLMDTIAALDNHPGFSFRFVRRALNRAAHGLAQWAANMNVYFRFDFSIPDCIEHFVIEDAIYG
ncbi:hypothetical protein GQ457_13G012300 [Hibiscus cannabinus]